MPNMMAVQPNIGGALCDSSVIAFLVACRKVWLAPAAQVPCSNNANFENARLGRKVKFAPLAKFRQGARVPIIVHMA